MSRCDGPREFPIAEMERLIRDHNGITTPEFAELLHVSVTTARWVVHSIDTLEFYDGNHIRFKKGNAQ